MKMGGSVDARVVSLFVSTDSGTDRCMATLVHLEVSDVT